MRNTAPRLYILCSNQLPEVYASVQGGHALAQWLIEHPQQTWNNKFLVYLSCDVEKLVKIFKSMKYDFSVFYEPDLDFKPTAIAILCDDVNKTFLRTLSLLKIKK